MGGLLGPQNLLLGARFLAALPRHLRRPMTAADARAAVSRRGEERAAALLALVRSVLAAPDHPLGELLRHAGCSAADVAEMLASDGVEGTLRRLLHAGVYLTVDELKGRTGVRRGSMVTAAGPERLRNPRAAFHVPVASSGSRSAGTAVLIDLEFVRGCAAAACVALAARGGAAWRKATWEVPGAGARFRLLKYAAFGAPPVRWFSQLDPRLPGQHPVIRLATVATRWGSLAVGVPLPRAEHAPLATPLVIARWMREELAAGRVPHLFTFPSSAVALCEAAGGAGIDIAGARLTVGGEPITAARMAAFRRAGVEAMPRYGSIECGPIGYGCLAPAAVDEVHLVADLHALIPADDAAATTGLPTDAVLVTALHPRAPFAMLNVSMGDRATLTERRCGCPLEAVGWTPHLHDVRSFEKLTGAGMTFAGGDVIRILEEELPRRFGGGPTSYQLVEDEDGGGRAVLRLLAAPELGDLDDDRLVAAFLDALAAGDTATRLMAAMLRESGVLSVERRAPLATRSGKRLHLALAHRSSAG